MTVVYWAGSEAMAIRLAEMADWSGPWPGLTESPARPIRILLASSDARFDSLTAGRVPEWGVGAAFPSSNTIVLRLKGDPRRALRHELAHLALHSVVRRVPRWFDEGYAARAAGEWDRLNALRVNWALVRGAVPALGDLDRSLRLGGAAEAEAAYALATTAVLYLERLGGDRGLAPMIGTLSQTADFDHALRATHQLTLGAFEAGWRDDVRKRYGWLLVLGSATVFWTLAALWLVPLWIWRRERDRGRRAALDHGWNIPEEEWNQTA